MSDQLNKADIDRVVIHADRHFSLDLMKILQSVFIYKVFVTAVVTK